MKADIAEQEIERLRSGNRRMSEELRRVVACLDVFIAEHADPGSEALSAAWCAKQTLRNLGFEPSDLPTLPSLPTEEKYKGSNLTDRVIKYATGHPLGDMTVLCEVRDLEVERDKLRATLALVQPQADAGMELAELASYAEIVGGIGVNRPGIRKWCDTVFAARRAVEAAELSGDPEPSDLNAKANVDKSNDAPVRAASNGNMKVAK